MSCAEASCDSLHGAAASNSSPASSVAYLHQSPSGGGVPVVRASPRRYPDATTPRTTLSPLSSPRTNRAAQVRIQSKHRSHSMTEVNNQYAGCRSPRTSAVAATGSGSPKRSTGSRLGTASKENPTEGDVVQEYSELPKLPLPSLQTTLDQYLDNIRAIMDEDEFQKAEAIVREFGKEGGVGEAAHNHLHQLREDTDNWAYDYWLKDMYLSVRLSLPINFNPGMVFPKQSFRCTEEMIAFTTRLLMGFAKYKDRLDRQCLLQEKAASREPGQPLCMAQYYRLLSTCRRPGKEQDTLDQTPAQEKEEEHVIVGTRGHWYKLPMKSQGKWVRQEQVYSSLFHLLEEAEQSQPRPLHERVAAMTANNRSRWAEGYEALREANADSLAAVEDSLLALCLDEDTQNPTDTSKSKKDMLRQMLTGCGTRYNGTNRWFDKTVQLVVSMDGTCGLCYEHSTSEGVAVVQLLESIIKGLGEGATVASIAYHSRLVSYTQLTWQLNPLIHHIIQESLGVLDGLNDNADVEVMEYTEYGRELMKSCKCSPDVWLQLALQYTIFLLYGHIVPTYESASTRRYRLGRVDSIRASHSESLAWCRVMANSTTNKADKRQLFETAAKKQTQVMVDNILGHGLDIPLLGLREATKEIGQWEHQTLFTDPQAGYERLNQFLLSTSQVAISLKCSFMGYGAVVPDGYGVSYNPYPDRVIFCIASFYSSPKTDSRSFAKKLTKALQEMRDLYRK